MSDGRAILQDDTRETPAQDATLPRPVDRANDEQKPAVFAHPTEEEFARILDFYGVHWQYEPHSFPLRWSGERVIEMFTPDFYLPDLDLYVELTTMKQSLVTKKNRKLRRLRALYPHINIKLFYKKDYRQLAAKYGLRPEE